MARVLLTGRANQSVESRLGEVTPVVLAEDVDAVDVAWASSGVFMDPKTVRHFFGAARSSETLRWLNTNAAGADHPESPLWAHPRVVLTPHSSALGADRHSRAASIFLDNLTRYVAAEPLVNVVTDTELIG